MRTTLTAIDSATSERVDVLVELASDDRVSALEAALTTLLHGAPRGLWLGPDRLDPEQTVAAAGVKPGCLLSLGGPGPDLTRPVSGVELHVVSGPDAGQVHPLPAGDTVVGQQADVSLSDADTDRRHLQLHRSSAGIVATNVGASGTTAAGEVLIGSRALGAADLLEVGNNLLAVVPARAPDAAVSPGPDLTVLLNRPPRLRPGRSWITVELPAQPVATAPRKLAVLPLVLPVLLGIVLALVTHSPLFLLFTLLSPAVAISGWRSDRRSSRSGAAKNAATYDERLAAAYAEVNRLAAAETVDRRESCPDPAALLLAATGPGRRVWERRRSDDDSLLLRVGTGTLTAASVCIAGSPTLLHDCPATVPLREVGVLGLTGPPLTVRSLARWLVGQSAVLHSPRDLSVVLLTAEAPEPSWDWLRWLPHTAPTRGQDCAGTVGTNPDSVAARIAELTALIAIRRAAAASRTSLTAPRPADVLVVLDGARALRALPGMASVLQEGPAVGVHLVCLDEQEGLLPEECRAVVGCEGTGRLTLRRDGEAQWEGVRGDLVSPRWAEQVARGLAPLRDGSDEQGDGQIPSAARLLDLLDLERPTASAVLARMGRTTEAVVGVGVDGPFALDLRRDGPHALIAGTTGSGKSELLQTLVASLAVANRTDALTFVLVDYKGGAAFKDCARLPHVVGMVTDLDGHLVERALASLTAELKTREQLLARAGVKDIEDLWAAGAALPRLVIVIDEFASLVEELPDFVRGLVGIAQRGRSLGVHLVLATQRPGGVVSPEIRANTNLRIALRVTDASESLDVVDAADAAAISRSTPGRGYVRTGHASLTAFQAARVGGRTPGAAQVAACLPTAVPLPWSRIGEPLPPLSRDELEPDEDQTDLHALVLAVQEACADDPPARSPWLAALPTTVTLAEARRASPELIGLPTVAFGLEDLPAEQTTRAAVLDLEHGGHLVVAGAARSGRSTFLRTLGTSLAATVLPSDAHVYAIDCGNGSLLALSDLPHVGAVVLRSQVERADRLLSRLVAEVTRRQEVLAERGFADLAEQRATSADPFPYLVLLVDRWEGFTAAFEEIDNGRLVDTLLRLLREGPGAGLRVVITGDRSVLLGKVATSVEDVLCLRLAERSDYALAGLSPRVLPQALAPGRAFRARTGTEIQIALLVADDSGPAQNAALGELVEHWRGRRIGGRLPFRVEALPTAVVAGSVGFDTGPLVVPVGVGGDDLTGQVVDLALVGPGFTIAGPPRSGRSTALLAAARGLLAAGTELVVLAPRPSPLRDLAGTAGVLHLDGSSDPDLTAVAAALNRAGGPLVVLVDDAELLHPAAVGDLLQQVLRDGRDQGHAVVVAGTTEELATCFRGFTADARKSRTGLLLSPASHLEGELLGVRLPRSAAFTGPPGRGLLIRGGQVLLVQVPH